MSQILAKGFVQLSNAAWLVNEGRVKSLIFACRSGTHRSVGAAALVAEWLVRDGGHGGWRVVDGGTVEAPLPPPSTRCAIVAMTGSI